MKYDFQDHIICTESTIKDALQALNKISAGPKIKPMNLLVVDKRERMLGTLTDGDIRRGLLSGKEMDDGIRPIMNSRFHYLEIDDCSTHKIKACREEGIKLVPILNQDRTIADMLDLTQKKSRLPLDAFLMAGGQGRRLRPLTEHIPKPLLEVGEKPIIEYMVDRIEQFGIPNITICVRYLGEQLIDYFEKHPKWDLNISFIKEDQPLGTIGALSLVDHFQHDTILLSNADLLSTINYESFFEFFKDTDADMAVASVPYQIKIPYGIFKTNGTKILSVQEKPEYTYYSNAGIYLIKRNLIHKMPRNSYYDVTDFLDFLITEGYNVTYYPILGYWQDIGQHKDFNKVQKDINLIEV